MPAAGSAIRGHGTGDGAHENARCRANANLLQHTEFPNERLHRLPDTGYILVVVHSSFCTTTYTVDIE